MKRTALAFSCLLVSIVVEAQVYQYKDAAGRTVYSDTPPTGSVTKSRTVAGEASSTAPAAAPAAPKSTADREMEFKKRQKEQQEAADKAAKETADKAARREDCERAKRSLQILESGERVTSRDEKGERVFLDDDQRAAETERARKSVTELCK